MGPLGFFTAFLTLASTLIAPPLAALLVLLWPWLSRTSLADVGLKGREVGLARGRRYRRRRRLWSLMIAHAAFDVLAIYLIYAGLEERVAHAVFP